MKRAVEALTDETFDLAIIGGGITGAGIALDAASRGWRVALIDRADFGSGTSSMSSKLVHGGLRYLEYGQFSLVHEALQERGRLLRNAPHLVTPLPFVLPFYAGQRIAPWKWRLGLTLYDFLAGPGNIARSRPLSIPQILADSTFQPNGLIGGALFHDALMDDARLCIAVLQTASRHGAVFANYVEATGFEQRDGRIVAIRTRDRVDDKVFTIRCRVAVNAAGPGVDSVCRLAGEQTVHLAPTKGVHLIASAQGHRSASLLLHPRDGRVFFVIPWFGKTLIGTTDTNAGADALTASPEDVQYLLEGYNHHFVLPLSERDVIGSFVGLRPLIRARPDAPSARSREFRIVDSAAGLVTVLGGKYTTFRAMAEEIVDHLASRVGKKRRCQTYDLPLIGTPKAPWPFFHDEVSKSIRACYPITADSADHLVHRYGDQVEVVLRMAGGVENGFERMHPDEPDLLGEQAYQRAEEMAISTDDLLLRRTRIGLWRPELARRP